MNIESEIKYILELDLDDQEIKALPELIREEFLALEGYYEDNKMLRRGYWYDCGFQVQLIFNDLATLIEYRDLMHTLFAKMTR